MYLLKCLERQWRWDKTEIVRKLFTNQRLVVLEMMKTAKADYIKQQITDCTGHSQFYRIIDEALHLSSKPKFPSHTSAQELAERFNNFFGSKICSIREELDSSHSPSQINVQAQFTRKATPVMDMFDPVNEEELLHIIAASPSKSCSLDPISTRFLKQHA